MTAQDVLDKARDSFRRQSWEQAFAYFHATDADRPLDAEDLELLGRAAYLTGRDTDCVRALERAYQQRAAEGQHEQAAEAAFWLAFNLMGRGEMAQAGGWLARAEHLVALADEDCAVRGLLLVPTALRHLMEGDATTSLDLFTRAHELGRRCGDAELEALGALGEGQSWIALGEPARGLARLDEVMVAVTAGEVSPVVSGLVYCAVIVACQETYEVQRAAESTKALSSWCDARPDLVPFRGQCLVHRAQILQLKGAWQEALEQVRLACRRLSDPPGQPAVGMALYEEGELHRLRGQYPAAEEAYRAASRCGHETQPGLALLRLAQGNLDAAHAGILRALDECHGHMRPLLLAAAVEIELAAGRLPEARGVAAELADLGGDGAAEVLRAMSAQATGAVLLAEGDPGAALARLRRAGELWRDLDAPYPGARVRHLRALACRELGDHDAVQMELDAAAEVFRQLGAAPDLAALEKVGTPTPVPGGRLTVREIQVLRAVASGKTNRAVAEDLFLSEKTVARHLSNIFAKLDVSSRSAATAYAYEHHLV